MLKKLEKEVREEKHKTVDKTQQVLMVLKVKYSLNYEE